MGVTLKEFIACGGGARSPMWRQMFADVMDTPVSIAPASQGPALGAAILAAVGGGLYSTVEEACRQAGDAHDPLAPKASDAYEPYYQIYRELYPALASSFKKLSRV